MSTAISALYRYLLMACLGVVAAVAYTPAMPQSTDTQERIDVEAKAEHSDVEVTVRGRSWHRHDNGIVSFGRDSVHPAGERVAAVVSIFGSSTSDGEVDDAVVSILGNTRVTGSVGDAAVAVMGSVYVNSSVGGDVVAVMGNVELGPDADIGGNVVVVGGTLKRDPSALIHGTVDRVAIGGLPQFEWLKPWVENCLLYARPLALAPGLGWAWTLSFGFLALYVLLALLFRSAVDRCVGTLEAQPGHSILAALITLVFTPIVFVLLFITVIGIFFVPFLGLALFCVGLFGKAVMLAALGRRVTRHFDDNVFAHTAFAVIVGGVFVLALYLIPVVGFIVYKVLGILGLGVVVYTLLLATKDSRRERTVVAPAAATPETVQAESARPTASPGSTAFTESAASAEPSEPSAAEPQLAAAPMLPRAGFWIRMGALAIDAILIGVLFEIFSDADRIWLLVLATYGAIMWKLRGTTIGGVVFSLQVVRVDGRPVDWGTAVVRALGCFLSLIVAGLGFIWIVFDDGKQAWHDKIAGTAVVRTPKGVSLV